MEIETVGSASSSVMVTTVLVALPRVALVGEVPSVTVNVSLCSSRVSEAMVRVMSALVFPAVIVRLPFETEV